MARNPATLGIIGAGVASGIGLGTGFAVANAATKPVVESTVAAVKGKSTRQNPHHTHHPALDQSEEASMSARHFPKHARAAFARNQERAKWMGPRMHAYIEAGLSPRSAMQRAAADWRRHGRTLGNPFAQGELVKIKTLGGEPGQVEGVEKGKKSKGFLGLWTNKEPDQYHVRGISGGQVTAYEGQLKHANPGMHHLVTLGIIALIAYGLVKKD